MNQPGRTREARLLLVSGGSLIGANLLDALEGRRHGLSVAATNSEGGAQILGRFDRVFLTPPTRDRKAFEQRLLEVMDACGPDLVIPCRDDDVVALATLRDRRHDLAGRLLCGSAETALASCDKRASHVFCERHRLPFAPSLPTPAAIHSARTFAARHGYPLLLKPARGFASRQVRLILDDRQLQRASREPDALLQRFLGSPAEVFSAWEDFRERGLPLFHSFEGLKHSLQVMIGPSGEVAGTFASVNVNRNGTSLSLQRHHGEPALELAHRCAQAFAAAGARGPLNIQCQETPEGELMIYEFNARFSGATAARRLMGYDEVGLALELFLGVSLPGPGPAAASVTRVAVDQAGDGALAGSLEAYGEWHRSATGARP